MANEEQRKAFEAYMGNASASNSQGQPIPQYPGSVANPGNPGNAYLYGVSISSPFAPTRSQFRDCTFNLHIQQHFPGLGAPPAAPTPPPAAPSSIASYPSYQNGAPQPGYGQGGYGLGGFPHRPPPLGQAAAPQHQQQQMPPPARPPGYVQVPRSYNAQPPPPPGYHVGWQYTDPMAEQNRRLSGAPASAMAPTSRNTSGDIVESQTRQTNEYYHYQQYGRPSAPPAPPAPSAPAPVVEEIPVPVMLCHTCSHCGRMRSTGYHRHHPVVPGKPLVSTPCRRCKKKIRFGRHSSITRIRSCTADEPCDWPRESLHIDIDHHEHRGRRRDREKINVSRYSPSPPPVRRSSSEAHLGLRVLQQPAREIESETKVRVSSLSPHRSSRYGDVWPPPDVVRMRASRSDNVFPAPPEPHPGRPSRADEVWPPPDVVPTHSYRKVERSSSHRRSSRIVELTPSPPPARTRATRVVYRSESQERRPRSRSVSPVRVRVRQTQRDDDAEARIRAHPSAYRPVLPDHRYPFRESDETSSNNESAPRRRVESPNPSILKPRGMSRETEYRRRSGMRDSQQSVYVEVGGPRVQFASDRRSDRPAPVSRGEPKPTSEQRSNSKKYEHYHDYSRHLYVDEPPNAPPTEDFDRLRIRRSSLSPRRSREEEIRIDRARRISPSPPPRRYEEVRVRHISPPPARGRIRRPPPSLPSPETRPYSGYRHISRTRSMERIRRSLTPPPSRPKAKEQDLDDVTDSDSAASGDVVEVRTWKGIDENGQPATFVEERRTVRMIDRGSDRGGGGEFGPLRERVASRSWRDI